MIKTQTLSNDVKSVGRIIIYDGCSLEITPETWTNKKLRKAWIKLIDKHVEALVTEKTVKEVDVKSRPMGSRAEVGSTQNEFSTIPRKTVKENSLRGKKDG